LAFNVRVTGPEFASEENQRAFLRIEETARQYSAHSRESIYLVRRPLEISEDHFVLLWPRGAAIVGMYPWDGLVRGPEHGEWESAPATTLDVTRRTSARSHGEHSARTFANPHSTLERACKEFSALLLRDSLEPEPLEAIAAPSAAKIVPAGRTSDASSEDVSSPIALIALFTVPAVQLRVAPVGDALFSVLTIEDAMSRSIVHTPNLLRATDLPGVSYSTDDLERICGLLERSARARERVREQQAGKDIPPSVPSHLRPRIRRMRFGTKWLVLLTIVVALAAFFVIRSAIEPPPSTPARAPQAAATRPPSEIVIKMPVEAELFISQSQFQTRQQLDRALTYGEGQRFLPDTEQIVVKDSVSLAKGVYGYFKVDNTWRKGKLLQTLQPIDTITVVKFLDPLP